MHFQSLAVLAAASSAQATYLGFNYGSTFTDGSAKQASDFETEFNAAKQLAGTNSEFTSARLYTMIQATTANTPISAISAAIKTKTSLLLGIWASAGEETITNEIAALKTAISQYGSDFTDLIAGISVGSEDLYRNSVTGVSNKAGIGANPDLIVQYIKEVRSAISGTAASGAKIGHVDTWDAWTNGTNAEVIANVDWLGMDTYPYFQKTQANGIENSKQLFDDAYDVTSAAANGKEVWVTESGWPVSGDTQGQGVPSNENAEKYWKETGCSLFGKVNTWWYILDDSLPTTPSPSFGILASLTGAPLYDLTCDASSSSSSSASASSTESSGSSSTAISGGPASGNPASTTAASSGITTSTAHASGASGSPITGSGNGTHSSASPSASGTYTGAGNQVMYSSGALAIVFAALAYAF